MVFGDEDPAKFLAACNAAHARFAALKAKAAATTVSQVEWQIAHDAAVRHGLARPGDSRILPADPMQERGRFDAFTAAALAETDAIPPQRVAVPFATKPPRSAFELLAKARRPISSYCCSGMAPARATRGIRC